MEESADENIGRIDALNGDINIESVSFKYPGEDSVWAIRQLSVVIPRGKTTAIVGPSGCGKSTLLKLLQGLYQPIEGRILGGDIDISTLSTEEWGKICSGVSQSGYIFSDTFIGNIALADAEPDMVKVSEAIKIACIDEFIESLPLKENTVIGPQGKEISGGQKQRLMIARAIYHDTPLILLDEATSSLDSQTERKIVDNLTKFGKNRTMVIAAHRLSTILHADLILYMENGRIVEQGNHIALMAARGKYAQFVAGQL